MELFGIILCKAVIAAVMFFVIAVIVGIWYAFAKCNKEILILTIIIFLGLVIITLLAALFVGMACIPLLVNPMIV